MLISPIEAKPIPLVQETCIQTFEFSANPPQCGKPAAFLIKSIYDDEYSIMCDECKRDFFENPATAYISEKYRAYFYSLELNERFARELSEYITRRKEIENSHSELE